MTIEELASLVLKQTQARLRSHYPTSPQWEWERVQVKPGAKYTKIDRGPEHNMSGMLMIDNATGEIFGIKGYGRVHKGHRYGTLDTVADWYWGDYYPEKRADRRPLNRELFARIAPAWNCVAYPDEGMHYTGASEGRCAWCGKTAEQIAAEHRHCEDCGCQS